MLRTVLNKSWKQHLTREKLYSHLPPISQVIKVRRRRHSEYCSSCREEHLSDVLWWNPTHRHTSVGRSAKPYINQHCADTAYRLEDLPRAIADKTEWWARVNRICAIDIRWLWWWWWSKKISQWNLMKRVWNNLKKLNIKSLISLKTMNTEIVSVGLVNQS